MTSSWGGSPWLLLASFSRLLDQFVACLGRGEVLEEQEAMGIRGSVTSSVWGWFVCFVFVFDHLLERRIVWTDVQKGVCALDPAWTWKLWWSSCLHWERFCYPVLCFHPGQLLEMAYACFGSHFYSVPFLESWCLKNWALFFYSFMGRFKSDWILPIAR